MQPWPAGSSNLVAGSMQGDYSESYLRVFGAAFDAGIEAASHLSDGELEKLSRYSGIVGIVAQQVKEQRAREVRRSG